MQIETLPNIYGICMASVTVPFHSTCSIVGAPFGGRITVKYAPKDRLIEYMSLEKLARTFCATQETHESIAALVLQACHVLACPVRVDVWVDSHDHPAAWVAVGDMSI